MTDEIKPNNVKAIRSGIKLPEDAPKNEPNTLIISNLEQLLGLAKEGIVQDLCYVAVTSRDSTMSNILGSFKIPHIMHSELVQQATEFGDMLYAARYIGEEDDYE